MSLMISCILYKYYMCSFTLMEVHFVYICTPPLRIMDVYLYTPSIEDVDFGSLYREPLQMFVRHFYKNFSSEKLMKIYLV